MQKSWFNVPKLVLRMLKSSDPVFTYTDEKYAVVMSTWLTQFITTYNRPSCPSCLRSRVVRYHRPHFIDEEAEFQLNRLLSSFKVTSQTFPPLRAQQISEGVPEIWASLDRIKLWHGVSKWVYAGVCMAFSFRSSSPSMAKPGLVRCRYTYLLYALSQRKDRTK